MSALSYGAAAAGFQHARVLAVPFEAVLLEAPPTFAAMEQTDTTVTIRWQDPVAAFGRYGSPVLAELGQDLAARCERVADTILEGEQPCRSHVST